MATNPMQRKSRNAFLLGLIIALIIGAGVCALLYMRIRSLNEELEAVSLTMNNVYVLNQDVASGQVLTSNMFTMKSVPTLTTPTGENGATSNIVTTLSSYQLCDTNGRSIYMQSTEQGLYNYYMVIDGVQCTLYEENYDENTEIAEEVAVTALTMGDQVYYYENNQVGAANSRNYITIATNAVVAKIDLAANTVLTNSMIARSDEIYSDDVRETEYNVISLPIELVTEDYVDIRLMLPTGENYIVLSKKRVEIPVVNGAYLADTIRINATEEEILLMSCAIVDAAQIEGAQLYAVKYTEAGIQEAATGTYVPTRTIRNLINSDPNIVNESKQELLNRIDANLSTRDDNIDSAIENYGNEGNISSELEDSATSQQEAREDYLQSIVPSTTTTTTTN